MPDERLPLFAFGTLRRGQCNHHYLAGRYAQVRPARLPGYARVAELMIARSPGGVVEGELFTLSPDDYDATLAHCDELEEIPPGERIGPEYRRNRVRVETVDGVVTAWAYVHPETSDEE